MHGIKDPNTFVGVWINPYLFVGWTLCAGELSKKRSSTFTVHIIYYIFCCFFFVVVVVCDFVMMIRPNTKREPKRSYKLLTYNTHTDSIQTMMKNIFLCDTVFCTHTLASYQWFCCLSLSKYN